MSTGKLKAQYNRVRTRWVCTGSSAGFSTHLQPLHALLIGMHVTSSGQDLNAAAATPAMHAHKCARVLLLLHAVPLLCYCCLVAVVDPTACSNETRLCVMIAVRHCRQAAYGPTQSACRRSRRAPTRRLKHRSMHQEEGAVAGKQSGSEHRS
jgi:hypothetical protein